MLPPLIRAVVACCLATQATVATAEPPREATVAAAEPPREAAAEPRKEKVCLSPPRRVASAGAAIVPGLILPGSGHLIAGDPAAGHKLMITGAIGLAGFGLAGAGVWYTGAARRSIGPFAALAITGFGIYLSSVFADLYGVLAPPGGTGAPARSAPPLHAELGYRYVYDPLFAYRSFIAARVEARTGRWFASPSVWAALDDANVRARLAAGVRLWGARGDGSYLELETAFTAHRFGTEELSTWLGEVSVNGRLDLVRLDRSFEGAFVELGTGYALGAVRYDDLSTDSTDLLLGRFALGIYLGHAAGRFGELSIGYDHRHDDFAAGLKMLGLGSGPVGHFVLRALWIHDGGWGALLDVQTGSAWVAGISLVYRRGGVR